MRRTAFVRRLGLHSDVQANDRESLGNGNTILCFHGSPKSNMDMILSATPEKDLEHMLAGFRASIMAGGHTHVQMLRRYKDMTIIKSGSVGLPYERAVLFEGESRTKRDKVLNPPWAEYAVVSSHKGNLDIDLRRVPLDLNAVIQAALNTDMPHAEWWAANWR